MAKLKEFERVSSGGLVNVVDEQAVARIPLHYCHGRWYGPNRDGGFSAYKDSQAVNLIAQHGFSKTDKSANEHGVKPCETAMLWLMQNRGVNYAGPLAGYPVGHHVVGNQRILVTEALKIVKPGGLKTSPQSTPKWPTIQLLIESLLQDEEHDQTTVFYTVLAARFRQISERMAGKPVPFMHCPALAIFGEFQSGKSALIDLVITPLFGGRAANPLQFLREGKFNKDLFPAALLVMDDKGASSNLEERRQRGDAMKSLIWTEFQRMEGKGADALMVSPFWWLILAGNFEDSSLNVCPALNESLKDKIILLKARRADGLPESEEQKRAWVARLHAELPAFADFLLKWKPLKGTKLDARSRVVNFWHPEISGALLEKQPECKAMEVIDLLDLAPWTGTATEFYNAIRDVDKGGHWERLFSTVDRCGRILTELSKIMPGRVVKKVAVGVSRYEIGRNK